MSDPGNCTKTLSSRGNSNCFGFRMEAARISSSKALFTTVSSDSVVSSTSITAGSASTTATFDSLETDSREPLRFRILRAWPSVEVSSTIVAELVVLLLASASDEIARGAAAAAVLVAAGVAGRETIGGVTDDVSLLRPECRRSVDRVFFGSSGFVMRQ